MPHFLFEANEGGVSNYGTYARTVVPFTVGFLASGLSMIIAAGSLPKQIQAYRKLYRVLALLGVLTLVVLLTTYPYQLNALLGTIHSYTSMALVIAETIASIWFAWILVTDLPNKLLFALQFLGFMLGVLTYLGLTHVLFIAESLASLGFGGLMVRTAWVRSRFAADSDI